MDLIEEIKRADITDRLIADRALDLICKKKYDCPKAAETLKIEVAELRLRLREELKLYRS